MRVYRADPDYEMAVTLDDVRANSRVDGDEEDGLIVSLIAAAQERAEQETGMVFGDDEWIIEAEPCGDLVIPFWPVASVVSVVGEDGDFADFTTSRSGRSFMISSAAWPGPVTIRVRAGMPAPETVKRAIVMMASYWFDNRALGSSEGVQEIPYAATALLGLNRRMFA